MRYLIVFFIISACEANRPVDFEVGDCALGGRMGVWKLTKKNQGKYLFVAFPIQEGAPVEIMEDISVLKKVECPR